MIPVKTETNYLMNWDDPKDRVNYFRNLRNFLEGIHIIAEDEVFPNSRTPNAFRMGQAILEQFKKWNVYFIDIPGDPLPRVNLDNPK